MCTRYSEYKKGNAPGERDDIMKGESGQLKKLLIQEGIIQMTLHGIENFSLREAAKHCGVSCAAPFKHFKDKGDYYREISSFLDEALLERMIQTDVSLAGDLEQIYMENSCSYIDCLVSHPFLMNLSFWSDMGQDKCMGFRKWKSLSHVIGNFHKYCVSLDMKQEDYKRVFYLMQNITYGTAFMATSGMLNPEEDYSIKLREVMKKMMLPI